MGAFFRHTPFMSSRPVSRTDHRDVSPKQHVLLLVGLAGLCGVTALAIDMLLPAVAQMASSFQTTQHTIQASLAIFVFVFGVSQLAYGAISDRLGRRRPLFASLAIFAAGSLLCAGAQSLEFLYVGRCLQGVGACGTAVGFMSILRDCFHGHQLAKNIAVVMGMASLAPVFAPVAGAWAATFYSWRLSFMFLAGFAATLTLGLVMVLPETHRPTQDTSPGRSAWRTVLTHPVFMKNSAIYSLSFLGLFAYLTIGAPILIHHAQLSVQEVGFWFAFNAVVFGTSNFVLAKVLHSFALSRLIDLGVVFLVLGGLGMLFPFGLPPDSAFMLPMSFVTIGVACIAPASQAAALEPFEHAAGTAASWLGFLRFTCASLLGFAIGAAKESSVVSCVTLLSALLVILLRLTMSAQTKKAISPRQPSSSPPPFLSKAGDSSPPC